MESTGSSGSGNAARLLSRDHATTGDNPFHGGRRSASASSSLSNKSRKTHSSSSPSSTANGEVGFAILHQRWRSVLSHPLALPLVKALHGNKPSKLKYLRQKHSRITCSKNELNNILEISVTEWASTDNRREPSLTDKYLFDKIEEFSNQIRVNPEKQVKVKTKASSNPTNKGGKADIFLSTWNPEDKEDNGRPLAVIEVGRNKYKWWEKFDQGRKYVDAMLMVEQEKVRFKFQAPLLLAILTIQGEDSGSFASKFGVFLCVPKASRQDYRITLLCHTSSSNLVETSKAFGRFLRTTSSFATWREGSNNNIQHEYRYLSSNCCLVKNSSDQCVILRSYDKRFRHSDRSPDIYMNARCEEIIGGTAKTILKLNPFLLCCSKANNQTNHENDHFWCPFKKNKDTGLWEKGDRTLKIISVPYKQGGHLATKPTDFNPIIDQLKALHNRGYVHGDIRGFNVVFNGPKGGLIDFDFSGIANKAKYPVGYKSELPDGDRIGSGEEGSSFNTLQKWHDWYALGNLIFHFHTLTPSGIPNADVVILESLLSKKWRNIGENQPLDHEVDALSDSLKSLEEAEWIIEPGKKFREAIMLPARSILKIQRMGQLGAH